MMMYDFTFVAECNSVPRITISGEPLGIVDCVFHWHTATSNDIGTSETIVSGYVDDEPVLRTFKLDFIAGKAVEIATEV